MKNLTTTLLVLFVTLSSLAQKQDDVLARVIYNFTHFRDTNSRNNPYTENMLLVIGKNASVYTSLDQISRNLNIPGASGAPNAPYKPITFYDLFYFAAENKLMTAQRFMNAKYLVDEVDQKINWKITKDTASFAGIHCKKALTNFKGRKYTAWYAPEMPFASGPWKLNGLPGLIIEAYDDKKEVRFEFAGLDNLKKEKLTTEQVATLKLYEKNEFFGSVIILPIDAKKTTRADFDKAYEAYLLDPIGFSAAQIGVPRNKVFAGSSPTGMSHNIVNNPIELPEKK